MSSWTERAFDQVNEITKQVLTLATGIVAITLTFSKDFATHETSFAKDVLAWSWGVYVVSIIFGFMTLMASAGLQQAADEGTNPAAPSINSGNLRWLGGAQLLIFLIALIMTVIAGALAT
jgi:hypothetical protein